MLLDSLSIGHESVLRPAEQDFLQARGLCLDGDDGSSGRSSSSYTRGLWSCVRCLVGWLTGLLAAFFACLSVHLNNVVCHNPRRRELDGMSFSCRPLLSRPVLLSLCCLFYGAGLVWFGLEYYRSPDVVSPVQAAVVFGEAVLAADVRVVLLDVDDGRTSSLAQPASLARVSS